MRSRVSKLGLDLERPDAAGLDDIERARDAAWTSFYERMHETAPPAFSKLIGAFRQSDLDVLFARIACQLPDGRDRSFSQKSPAGPICFCSKTRCFGHCFGGKLPITALPAAVISPLRRRRMVRDIR
jgi:hypothetical protein